MAYRGRWFVREKIYICGDYMDADVYPVFQPPGKRRKKCKPTSKVQEKLNQKNAEKKITRLAHANFTEDDLALHLTYAVQPESPQQAQKDLQNFLRRVKRRRKKLGLPDLKYISCTEEGKTTGRLHHHLILSGGMDRDELEKTWGKGYANSRRLQFGPDGIQGLAKYISKGDGNGKRLFYKRWNQSRNLIKPEPQVRDGAISMAELDEMEEAAASGMGYDYFSKKHEDFELVEASATRNELNRGCYIHYEMRRKKGIHGKNGPNDRNRTGGTGSTGGGMREKLGAGNGSGG